jgi:hypothetical protein
MDYFLVNVTPAPIFARLERLNNRMLRFMKMFGRMFVFGIVAAADVSAGQTQTQMDPLVAHFQTFLAPFAARRHLTDLVKMCAFRHLIPPPKRWEQYSTQCAILSRAATNCDSD